MLIPNKHIKNSESILGLGSFVLQSLSAPKTVDEIWGNFHRAVSAESYASPHTYDNIILAIDFLYSIGAIEENEFGKIFLCV